ncbi:MAG: host-nuclease inhibitor Gam family protein [Deltaproteobacteria bacterium]|nr:host-nuclease inhibitor Gam family protein [Deltaproteobacteria bacterium]
MKKEIDPVRRQLDALLALIRTKQAAIEAIKQEMTARIEAITAEYKPGIEAAGEDLKAIEAELIGLARFNKATLFAGTDRVDVRNGAVLRQVARRVKRIKGMLAKLKAAGREEAIRRIESVDWDEVEKWSEEILKGLGTRRVPKEIFAYEVKEE